MKIRGCLALGFSALVLINSVAAQDLKGLSEMQQSQLTCDAAKIFAEANEGVEPLVKSGGSSQMVAAPMPRFCKDIEGEVTVSADVSSGAFDSDDWDAAIVELDKLRRKLAFQDVRHQNMDATAYFIQGPVSLPAWNIPMVAPLPLRKAKMLMERQPSQSMQMEPIQSLNMSLGVDAMNLAISTNHSNF